MTPSFPFRAGAAPATALSFTDIASYQIGSFLTLGAGFMFDAFYGADDEAITPTKKRENQYYTLSDGRKMAAVEYDNRLADSVKTIPDGVVIVDTNHYTFAGQKAMGRFTLDLGKLIGEDLLRSSTFKLYGEGIVLGLKDYPTFYTNIMDRVVLMAGIEVPTFGILDMLSFEYERSTNPYPNTTRGANANGLALPFMTRCWTSFRTPFANSIATTSNGRLPRKNKLSKGWTSISRPPTITCGCWMSIAPLTWRISLSPLNIGIGLRDSSIPFSS